VGEVIGGQALESRVMNPPPGRLIDIYTLNLYLMQFIEAITQLYSHFIIILSLLLFVFSTSTGHNSLINTFTDFFSHYWIFFLI